MEKSCENCRFANDDPPCMKWDCQPWESMKYWQPDYPTLERENTELKKRLESMDKAWCDQHERRRKAQKALEMACEWQVKIIVDEGYRCCESCPFQLNKKICLKYSGGCDSEKLKTALIKHFKEGWNNG